MTHDRPRPSHPADADLAFIADELARHRPDPALLDIGALLDDELSDADRSRVEAAIADDPESQHTYRQLSRLSRELKRMPVPSSTVSPEELANRTIATVQERKKTRRRLWSSWGGTAIAALFVAAVSVSGGSRSERNAPEVAVTPTPTQSATIPSPAVTVTPDAIDALDADDRAEDRIKAESPLISRALFVE